MKKKEHGDLPTVLPKLVLHHPKKKKVKGTFLERTPQPLEHYLKTYRFVHVLRVHLGVRFGQACGSGRLGELEQVGRPAAGRHSSSPGGHPWGDANPATPAKATPVSENTFGKHVT